MNTPRTILIRATVIEQQDKLLTVKLDDGFGNITTPVHEDQLPKSDELFDAFIAAPI